ncbi:MBOAT family protein [Burkholderiales bacterium]|jgi:alginate O-acetyltransferase complex protein AlgI|nr:MBOAT family protein [Burkholderiales bacterium]
MIYSKRLAIAWLCLASLIFYAWWDYQFFGLLLFSAFFNLGVGRALISSDNRRLRAWMLAFGVSGNLCLLALFKYADWFIASVNTAFEATFIPLGLILPVGISFYTFTQTAYLVDVWREKPKRRYGAIEYVLFVTYFPHLVAGPILHHKQMMPQFETPVSFFANRANFIKGATLFAIGLSKKLLIADPLGSYADLLFNNVNDVSPGIILSWFGAFAYAFQLYFDFSGYSDMAIGLSLLFGISLPINFLSPYQATSIIDFWRRWHISLSSFLKHYLYIPLGGSRVGGRRHIINLLITMFLGGLWHGANWTFVLWGLAHGLMLVINHIYRNAFPAEHFVRSLLKPVSKILTLVFVTIAWVLFRSENVGDAMEVYAGMVGVNGISLPMTLHNSWPMTNGVTFDGIFQGLSYEPFTFPMVLLVFAFLMAAWGPSSMSLVNENLTREYGGKYSLTFLMRRPLLVGLLFGLSLLFLNRTSPFLYFQF